MRVPGAGENAAGTGARIALLDLQSRELVESQVRDVEKIETAVEEKFQEHFVAAMSIPHQSDAFLELTKVIELPERVSGVTNRRPSRRRRRR